MEQTNFDNYTLGTIVGQTWEGGTTGTGVWSGNSKHSTIDDTGPEPQIIVDPTGDGRVQVLKASIADQTASADAIWKQFARYTLETGLYPASHIITVEWDQYQPGRDSFIEVQEGDEMVNDSAFYCKQYLTQDGILYPSGDAVEGVVTTLNAWQHVIAVYNFDTMTVSFTVDGVAPSVDPQSFEASSYVSRMASISFEVWYMGGLA